MLRLHTFGGLFLDGEAARGPGRAAQRKRLALLAVLTTHRHRPLSREKLLGLFWPERPGAEGRHALAQLVYAIRHESGTGVLVSGADDLRTDPAGIGADVVDFLDALERGDLETAMRGYTGPFLDGFYLNDAPDFEHWVEEMRADFAARAMSALDTLGRDAAAGGRFGEAVEWQRRRAALDPLSGSAAFDLMRSLVAAGDPGSALRHGSVHERLRHAELGLPPDARIVALMAELRAGGVEPVARPPSAPLSSPAAVAGAAPSSLSRSTPRRRRSLLAAGAMVAALATGFGVLALRRLGARPAAVIPRLVVLGAIDGPDSTLALAVREALRSGLEGDPTIRVLGSTRMHEMLRLMARPVETRLSEPVATEVALRSGATFAVVGAAVPLGSGVEIVVRTVNPRTGQALQVLSEHAADGADVIPALVRIRENIRREAIGAAHSATLAPLPPVMTASLPALQDYALAREAMRAGNRERALLLAQAALGEDSMFPMANYLVGDLDWFSDRQRDAELHLTRALFQSDRLPLRERLLVQARFDELVADQSDSAMVLWQRLRQAFPDDGQAYEGMAWTLRALGRYPEAAAAADTALRLDSTSFAPSAANEVYALLDEGDTVGARRVVQEYRRQLSPGFVRQVAFCIAVRAHDWSRALAMYSDQPTTETVAYEHVGLLLNGRFDAARALLDTIRRLEPHHQFLPRAIVLQARAALAQQVPSAPGAVRDAARAALGWLASADLSAPAVARIAEHIAELAACAGDRGTIAAVRRLVVQRDNGHGRPSLTLALMTIAAADAFARGDYAVAAARAHAARSATFHGRSLALAGLLEADARAALGQRDRARALYAELARADQFAAGDLETWAVLQPEVERKALAVTVR